MKSKLIFTMLIVCSLFSSGQIKQLPVDAAFRIGKLTNGITYYIRKNQEPKERASFYIIQNVGALLEEDNQNGLAHFLEHMAFNGTENFPGKGIINSLQNKGVDFGRNINAYTSYLETVYNLSDIPSMDRGLVDTCLLILRDWSHYLLLTNEEIDAERGVITEEWRTRRTPSTRLQKQFYPVLMKDSKYVTHDVIGNIDVIKNFKYDELRNFYHDWYRTDRQGIAVIGDIDVDAMEEKIKVVFGSIPVVSNPRPIQEFNIPFHREVRCVVATDAEATSYSVGIYIKLPSAKDADKNLDYYREKYIRSIFNSVMSSRISELLELSKTPFSGASISISGMVKGLDMLNISANCDVKKGAESFELIYREALKAKQYGFFQSEVDRAVSNIMAGEEASWKQRDKKQNESYMKQVVKNFTANEPLLSNEEKWKLANEILPNITAQEVSNAASRYITDENRTIIIMGPSKENTPLLSEKEAYAIIDKVNNSTIEHNKEEIINTALIDQPLKGSKVVKIKKNKELDAVEMTLANHVKVIYRFADYDKDFIFLNATSSGGISILNDNQLASGSLMMGFVQECGVDKFSSTTLSKMLMGKRVSLNPTLGGLSEGFNGNCSPKDFETLMQLIYLYFEKPRFDMEIYNTYISRLATQIENKKNDPSGAISDSMSLILSNHNKRTRLMDSNFIKEASFEEIKKIYRDRFSDAGDFTFFIVGNIPLETVQPLVEKYLGSLTNASRKENWIDRKVQFPEGKTAKEIILPLKEKKATPIIVYSFDAPYNPKSNLQLQVLQEILKIRYTEEIREKEGGTYGVSVRGSSSQFPVEKKTINISFDTNPEKVDYLKSIVYREIEKIQQKGPRVEDIDKVIKSFLKNREQSKQSNMYWGGVVVDYYTRSFNTDLKKNYEDILVKMTPKDIQNFVRKYLPKADLVDVVFKSKAI